MVISNHHGAPLHNLALDRAARALGRWTPLQAVSLSGNFMLDLFLRKGLHRFQEEQSLTEHREALDLDLHGGTFETSEMLHLAPQKVRARYKDLPAMVKPLHHLGPSSGVLGGTGYIGSPGLATADLGQAFIRFIVDAVTPSVRDFLTGAAPPKHLALKDRALLWLIGHTAHVKDFFKARRAYAAVQTPSSTSTL
jgi:creatinine amidohydrolase/Fe(II)-dependent formamide hydrolase-like protein